MLALYPPRVRSNAGLGDGFSYLLCGGSDAQAGAARRCAGCFESFFVLRGSVELSIDGKANFYGAGTLVHLPAGTVHGYHFGAGGGEMFEITGQGGNATRMFAQVDREVPPGPPDVPAVTALLRQNGVTLMLS
jgi:hypothetical protein